MKYCEEYLPALSALVDGELNDAERTEVLAHLEECEGCREFFAELSAMHAALGEMEEFDAPDGFAEGVMARLHEVAPKKRSHRTAWVSLAACAALVVVVLGTPLREQFGAGKSADSAAPEAAMLTMAAPQMEECAEEEYTDEFASVQNAPRTMMATAGSAAPAEERAALETEDFAADTVAELPRSVVFVYGAAREDYLIELATGFDYYADGTTAGYDLPTEKLDEFLALLEADGVPYDSSVAKQATTFYVQYEEAGANE